FRSVLAAPARSSESQTMVVPCVAHARHCRGGRPSRSIERHWSVGVFVDVTTDTGTPASSTASANVGWARESMSSHSSAMLMLLSCAATTIPYDPTAVGGSPVPQDPLALVNRKSVV